MMRSSRHHRSPCVATCCLTLCALLSTAGVQADDGVEYFEKHIRPLFVTHCYECHSEKSEKLGGDLSLANRAATRRGGESGPAVVPGDVSASLLIQAIRYDGLEMPPKQKLPADAIAKVEHWIKIGAPDPRDSSSPEPQTASIDMEAGKRFWAFQQPRPQPLPDVQAATWPQRRIDWFILHKLEQQQMQPSTEAARRVLARRVTFDLTGLPPTPEAVETFVNDPSPTAYEQLVERLLASPQYGERWARMWLDVARYAEDQAHIVGSNSSLFYPNAYLYRNWVIQALNDDLAYDEFIRQQLAADLLPDRQDDHQAALGFIGLGPKYYRRNDATVMADEWEDRVDTVTRGLLGVTLACARCHDHKFDPFETEDYYALAGVFASTEMFNRPLAGKKAEKNGHTKSPADALHIIRDKAARDLHVFIRGDVKVHGPLVKRRFIRVLSNGEPTPFQQGSGRLELASAITDRDNPLTARVMVNRVWALNFGKPLVTSPSNFGALGERPSHPELLDDLAVRFMDAGWSLKWLQRELVLSATYRQSSLTSEATLRSDPANTWLGRMPRRRLSVESWRDAMLAVTGQLTTTLGGKSMDPQQPNETRRTLYSRISRLDLNPLLAAFDFPDPNAHAAQRVRTTTPLQKLFTLNSPFMVAQASAFAHRLEQSTEETQGDPGNTQRIRRAYQLLFSRPPSAEEERLALHFLKHCDSSNQTAWQQYLQVLLASNEALYID